MKGAARSFLSALQIEGFRNQERVRIQFNDRVELGPTLVHIMNSSKILASERGSRKPA